MVDRKSALDIGGNENSDLNHDELGILRTTFRIIVHFSFATIGCSLIGFVLLGFIPLRPVGPHRVLITLVGDVPYSPVFWGSALLLSFLVIRRTRDSSACWVGPMGLFMLAVLIGLSLPGYERSGYEIKQTDHSFFEHINGELFSLNSNKSSSGGLGEAYVYNASTKFHSLFHRRMAWTPIKTDRRTRNIVSC
jgi:hypothetical protein